MSTTTITRALGVALLLLALAGTARADSAPLALRGAITGGGGALSAGDYTLVGAAGQPLTGSIQAGDYQLSSGVLPAPPPQPASLEQRVYLPQLLR